MAKWWIAKNPRPYYGGFCLLYSQNEAKNGLFWPFLAKKALFWTSNRPKTPLNFIFSSFSARNRMQDDFLPLHVIFKIFFISPKKFFLRSLWFLTKKIPKFYPIFLLEIFNFLKFSLFLQFFKSKPKLVSKNFKKVEEKIDLLSFCFNFFEK